MDIHELVDFADYFVICTGTSERMLQSLAEALSEHLKQNHDTPARLEGATGDGWLVLDTKDVVVHLFSPDQRDYYRLEELWSKAKVLLRLQ